MYCSYTGQNYDYLKDIKITEQATRIAELEKEIERLKEREESNYSCKLFWEGGVRADKISNTENCGDSTKVYLEGGDYILTDTEWFESNCVEVGDYAIETETNVYFMLRRDFESLFAKVEE